MATARGIRAGRAFVELFADDSKLVRGLRRAEKRIKAFGQSVRNLGLKVAGLGTALLAPLAASAKAFSSMGDQVAKMAKRTGLSVEALSELRFVASQTGTSLEALETGFRRMQRSIYDAGRGLSTATDALADLGLTFKDLESLAPEEQFKLLAEAISRAEGPTRRVSCTTVGRSWVGCGRWHVQDQSKSAERALQGRQRGESSGTTVSGRRTLAKQPLDSPPDTQGARPVRPISQVTGQRQ